jgi:hypothetical protein
MFVLNHLDGIVTKKAHSLHSTTTYRMSKKILEHSINESGVGEEIIRYYNNGKIHRACCHDVRHKPICLIMYDDVGRQILTKDYIDNMCVKRKYIYTRDDDDITPLYRRTTIYDDSGIVCKYTSGPIGRLVHGEAMYVVCNAHGQATVNIRFNRGNRQGRALMKIIKDDMMTAVLADFSDDKLNGAAEVYVQRALAFEGQYKDDKCISANPSDYIIEPILSIFRHNFIRDVANLRSDCIIKTTDNLFKLFNL